jgi:tetratricopeptide (TPR) repeat protein
MLGHGSCIALIVFLVTACGAMNPVTNLAFTRHSMAARDAQGRGDYLSAAARYEDAEREAVKMGTSVITDGRDTAATYALLAGHMYYLGKDYDHAEVAFKRGLARTEEFANRDHENVGDALFTLGQIYFSRKDDIGADAMHERAAEIFGTLGAKKERSLVAALRGRARAKYRMGRPPQEIAPLLTRAVPIAERQWGAKHPFVATLYDDLATVYTRSGRHDDAQRARAQAAAIRSK